MWLSHSSQTASKPDSVQFWPSSAHIHKTWRQSIPMASRKTSSWVLDGRFCWYPHCGKICHSPFWAKAIHTNQLHQQEIRCQQLCPAADTHLGRRRKREFPQDGPEQWWTPLSVQPLDAGLLQQKRAGGTGEKREMKIIKLCPRCRSRQMLIFKTHPFIRIGHTL